MIPGTRAKRLGRGAQRVDPSVLREALRDGSVWVGIGKVTREGSSHYELTADDLIVHVELEPAGEAISCRLGSIAGGAERGVWAVPPVGTEVAVLVPGGDLRGGGLIVATFSTQAIPDQLSENTLVVSGQNIRIEATGDVTVNASGNVHLGEASLVAATDGVVVAQGVDTFTGSTYGALGNASSKVRAKK